MESSPFSTISELRRRRSEHETSREPPAAKSFSPAPSRLGRLSSVLLLPLCLLGLLGVYTAYTSSSGGGPPVCKTLDHPNILHDKFPNNATGNLNATIVIFPIPLRQARSVIPEQYRILEDAYRSLLPDFPEDMYPAVLQAGHDHNIRYMEYSIPDFSRIGFEFPFLDYLGDGYSNFRWAPEQMITATNKDALSGSGAYGTKVHPATFEPACDAYEAHDDGDGTYFHAVSEETGANAAVTYMPHRPSAGETYEFPLDFFRNVTNQPIFIDGPTCCQQHRLFDTRLSTGARAPVRVKAHISAKLGPFNGVVLVRNLEGVQVSTPFVENNYVPCESLKGSGELPFEVKKMLV